MVLVASTLAAAVAIVFATVIPNRVRLQLDTFHRGNRVVALDHQLANARAPLRGVVLNHHRKTGAWAQFLRERIVRLLPTTASAFEVNPCDSPVLHMESVRSAQRHAFTPPKVVEPVIVSFPGGALPETLMLTGPIGSSLFTVIVADLEPKLAGRKRIGTCK